MFSKIKHTIDLTSALQIASEITLACIELRWGVCLIIKGLLSLIARLIHLRQPQIKQINNAGGSLLQGTSVIGQNSGCRSMCFASPVPLQLNTVYTHTHTHTVYSSLFMQVALGITYLEL